MKRYTDANNSIRTPDALRAAVTAPAVRPSAPRRVLIVATAAALLAALGLGAAMLRPDDTPPPVDAATTAAATPATSEPSSTAQPEVNAMPTLKLTNVSYTPQTQYPNDFNSPTYSDDFTAWHKDQRSRTDAVTDAERAPLAAASTALMRQLLTSTDKTAGENRVFSPLNLYLALAMLAETTDTTSRAALLDLLGADSIETARSYASNLFTANYTDDGRTRVHLAASIWLRQGFPFKQTTLERLAITHHAESYSGVMGSPDLNAALQSWLNDNTGGLLKEQAGGIEFDPDTVLGLATTLYYKARWTDEFDPARTAANIFHAASGELQTDFMHRTYQGLYYDGEGYGAVEQPLGDGSMWLILPDKGTTPDAILAGDALAELVANPRDTKATRIATRINLALPKFDVAADLDLKTGLTALGLGDLFNADTADFTPLTDDAALADELYLASARHAARVKIDEEGCEGAAFTVMMAAGNAMPPPDEIDFILDRPFLFIVTSAAGSPLFAGVVEQP